LNLLRRSATKGQMLQCTDGTIYEAMTLQEAKSIARHLGLTLRTKSMSQKSRSSIISSEGPLSSSTPAVQLEPREGVKLPHSCRK
jgi:hypothetical protein